MKAACSSSRKRNPNCNSVVSDRPSHCKTWSSTKGTKTYERECKWWVMRLLHPQLLMHYTPCSSQLEYGTRDPVLHLWISGSLWVCNTWMHHCWEIICKLLCAVCSWKKQFPEPELLLAIYSATCGHSWSSSIIILSVLHSSCVLWILVKERPLT